MLKDTITKDINVKLEPVTIDNKAYFKISNSNRMRPFFMSIVSDSDHWMFISSNGGLTAGRKNSEYSIFPYYSDDKITESSEITGSKSIFQVTKNGEKYIWEPFSIRFQDNYNTRCNLYKSVYGNSVIFEEENLDLDLVYRYEWCSTDKYGFVKKSTLSNNGELPVEVNVLDGVQNVLPYGVNSALQNASSNLVDAYKRTELVKETGIGIFALSAIIVDKAEPSEALKANVVWSLGIENVNYLLSSLQLDKFRNFGDVDLETDVKAEKGAYFINSKIQLVPQSKKEWLFVVNVNQDTSDIVEISKLISEESKLLQKLEDDIALGTENLVKLNAASDGLQLSSDNYKDTRHFSNTLFNIMRGGIFDNGYTIEKWDLEKYLAKANKKVSRNSEDVISALPETFSLGVLKEIAYKSDDKNFRRLCLEYMPLKFSRRHGDPSRPWNKFSINTRDEVDGSKILDYEGNWRDIFQNWEALACSYPEFIESMIHKFLNATTFDGYNPYRVTKDGFDWEIIEPDDPWSYIGYWGDHQIIYLLKFLEFIEEYKPGKLESFFDKDLFVYANVPYKIKKYEDLLKNPKDTIEFDEELDHRIRQDRSEIGADGALLRDENRFIVKVNFIEKILATALAKLSNFIPEGGIWMNTQRPEWNDANNALVGNGVSMVTLYYLRRFLKFFDEVFDKSEAESVEISQELKVFFDAIFGAFKSNAQILSESINDKDRKTVLDALGQAGSNYREQIYNNAFTGRKSQLTINSLKEFVDISLKFLEQSIEANKREDNLYHAYNLMTVNDDKSVSISYLDEMLEGQVAVLSSGYLSSKENLAVLDGLKASKLFRPDQYSYILYPNKNLKGFMDRNTIPSEAVKSSELLQSLVAHNNVNIINKDIKGDYHFNGNFKNANDLKEALDNLKDSNYAELVGKDEQNVLKIFEDIFNHKAFTGRSGTFYGYEGLGSIYWHMVSKLLLAVMECCQNAIGENESPEVVGRLLEHYYEINEGIGVHKSPELYGAFPTDPYSHTPAGKGAQQPGMTGQVKEDILSRFGELGVFFKDGLLVFNPCMLRKNEFLEEKRTFNYIDAIGNDSSVQIHEGQLVFTFCQVPVIYSISNEYKTVASLNDGTEMSFNQLGLDDTISKEVFKRSRKVEYITVHIKDEYLK
ncbi:hypothetical protein [Winogradskyella sp. KYW1333]|uniref:hypothetical protein n=1 Tax=Winogradskyella sp. KYW1333 TaxID=2282123 RepID=UPI000DF38C93|nr:hypothetical protein [Winogradskyella sp. KYW1333]RCT56133.1 hypothetical protein DUZ96_01735 [Winogradskyella sp. KYW1333]